MSDFLNVLLLAAMPAAGNVFGGLLAEVLPFSRRALSLALHLAAGIVVAVVGIELMGEALEADPPWVPVLALVAGGGFAVLLDRLIGYVAGRRAQGLTDETAKGSGAGTGAGSAGAWVIYAGVAIDLFSDGIMIGAGSTISLGLGLLLALGQVPADIPEGFATIFTFKRQNVPRPKRLLLSLSFALPVLLGATVGYFAVRSLPEVFKLTLLAFTAGILLAVAMEEILTEAHEAAEDSRWDTIALVGGFALFALISAYLG
jgi:zinc transporter, ZIP family